MTYQTQLALLIIMAGWIIGLATSPLFGLLMIGILALSQQDQLV